MATAVRRVVRRVANKGLKLTTQESNGGACPFEVVVHLLHCVFCSSAISILSCLIASSDTCDRFLFHLHPLPPFPAALSTVLLAEGSEEDDDTNER